MIERNLEEIKDILERVRKVNKYIPKKKESNIGYKSRVFENNFSMPLQQNYGKDEVYQWK